MDRSTYVARVISSPIGSRWLALLGALSSLGVGCDRDVTVGGQVVTQAGEAIDKAEVLVTCPELCVSAVSDASGRFFGSKRGKCAVDCRLTVRKSGYEPFTDSIGRHCMPPGGGAGMCRRIWIESRLTPTAAPSATPPKEQR